MSHPQLILLVRFRSALSLDEVTKVIEERADQFRKLPGLQQKHYLRDATTGEYAGLYLWESPDHLAAYQASELRATIAEAYHVVGEPRVEAYQVVKTLREDLT
jgi:heme-degrading monooxygenase HmoA